MEEFSVHYFLRLSSWIEERGEDNIGEWHFYEPYLSPTSGQYIESDCTWNYKDSLGNIIEYGHSSFKFKKMEGRCGLFPSTNKTLLCYWTIQIR